MPADKTVTLVAALVPLARREAGWAVVKNKNCSVRPCEFRSQDFPYTWMGKLLNLFVSQFLHLYNGDDKDKIYLMGL